MTAQERREQIIEGATRLFAEKGFRGATTKEIAKSLSISEALMFRHFPSKEALYRAILKKRMAGSRGFRLPKGALRSGDDDRVFRSIAAYLIRKNTEDPALLRLLLYSALEGHDLFRIFFRTYALTNIRLLSAYIRQRTREKAFRTVSPFLTAQAFLGMVIHYVISREIYGLKDLKPLSPEKAAEALTQPFLKGLKAVEECETGSFEAQP